MTNEEAKNGSAVLHCTAFGNLRPADICEACEDCTRNVRFGDAGGKLAMLLTGSRANLANAIRTPGVALEDVVVVNAKRYQTMEKTLKTIAAMEPETHDEPFSSMRDITVACGNCQAMIDLAREALEVKDE